MFSKYKYWIGSIFILITFLGALFAQENMENVIKAGYVQKFTQFISWPNDEVYSNSLFFVVGYWKKSLYSKELLHIFENKTVNEKTVKIKQINTWSEINNCNVLIIPEISKDELMTILRYTQNKPILTISSTEGFAEIGVCINLYLNPDGYIRFEINYPALLSTGLKADSRLFKLARIINFNN